MKWSRRVNLRTLAELGRVSNLPTVLTNVLVGLAAASGGERIRVGLAAAVCAGVALLYFGGMVLNDVVDAEVDARERADRPIPRGRISRPAAGRIAVLALVVGVLVLGAVRIEAGVAAVVLVLCILVYDIWHKRSPAMVVVMGLCRGMVYVVAAAAVVWPVRWGVIVWPAGAVVLYTVVLTWVARREHLEAKLARPGSASGTGVSRATPSRAAAWLMPLIPVVGAVGLGVEGLGLAAFAFALMAVWMWWGAGQLARKRPRITRAVMVWIAGFCLVDAFFLALLDRPGLMAVAVCCFIVTRLGHRVVKGT